MSCLHSGKGSLGGINKGSPAGRLTRSMMLPLRARSTTTSVSLKSIPAEGEAPEWQWRHRLLMMSWTPFSNVTWVVSQGAVVGYRSVSVCQTQPVPNITQHARSDKTPLEREGTGEEGIGFGLHIQSRNKGNSQNVACSKWQKSPDIRDNLHSHGKSI